MNAARAFATAAVALACAAPLPARSDVEQPTGEQILARAKAVFRAHARPPFVTYTVVRRDAHAGAPDFENSYTLKVWCRASDRSALTRRAWRGVAYGSIGNITVAFDGYVDPGPPTADIFERALFAPRPSPAPTRPEPSDSPLPVIGGVVVSTDYDYRVTALRRDGETWHLSLAAKRDPDRNRLDDLWVDAATYEVARIRVRDHLYLGLGGQSIEDEFDVRFTLRDGLPLIASIHGQTREGEFETDYTFADVDFPASLPGWYFEPRRYGLHRDEAPS
jgi:hypothetical protein